MSTEVVSFVFSSCERLDARNASERRLSKKPRRRRNETRRKKCGKMRKKKTKKEEEEEEKKKKKARTKVDETRGILVCGHSRCLQPTIMIIAPESC